MDDAAKTKKSSSGVTRIEKFLSRPKFRSLKDSLTLLFFFLVIVGPTIYIFSTALNFRELNAWVFNDPFIGATRWEVIKPALTLSFGIAAIVTLIDVVIGLPMALILSRYQFRWKKIVDTIIDLPLAVPTSALGFSIFLFWGTKGGISFLFGLEKGLLSRGPLLIILGHVAFTYPYIVRSLKAVIIGVDQTYEHAARTLGASPLTVFRTITYPLMKAGLISGVILAFTRSLGETGATLILSGVYSTAPVLIVSWRQMLQIYPTAFLSIILIITAVTLMAFARFFGRRFGLPIDRVWPNVERFLSKPKFRISRNLLTVFSFLIFVLIPSLFIFNYMAIRWSGSPYTGQVESGVYYQVFLAPDRKWTSLLSALTTSLEVASIATAINIIAGLPMAFILVRRKWGRLKELLEMLIDIPLSVPTAALGFSFFYFWGARGLNVLYPGFWLIVLVHIAFTYPYIVRTLCAVIEGMDRGVEEAASTLGASPLTVFRTVTLPLISPGILAAAIMAFMRSLGETGATIVVMGLSRTIPVLIVDWVESLALPAASFACALLVVISFCLLLILRYILGWE
jgi:thiamine transport system permease protein